jgi:hypothetical protein
MAADVAGNFAAAGGVADMDCVLQVECFRKLRQIVGICVHVVAVPRLAGPAVSSAAMGNAAVSAGGKKKHLIFKGVSTKRPAMTEDHRLFAAPILIVDLYIAGIFLANSNVRHWTLFFVKFEIRSVGCAGKGGKPCARRIVLGKCFIIGPSMKDILK